MALVTVRSLLAWSVTAVPVLSVAVSEPGFSETDWPVWSPKRHRGDRRALRRGRVDGDVLGIEQQGAGVAVRSRGIAEAAEIEQLPAGDFEGAAVAAGCAAPGTHLAGEGGQLIRPDHDFAAVARAQRVGPQHAGGIDCNELRVREGAAPVEIAADEDRAAAGRAAGVERRAFQRDAAGGDRDRPALAIGAMHADRAVDHDAARSVVRLHAEGVQGRHRAFDGHAVVPAAGEDVHRVGERRERREDRMSAILHGAEAGDNRVARIGDAQRAAGDGEHEALVFATTAGIAQHAEGSGGKRDEGGRSDAALQRLQSLTARLFETATS